MRFRLVVPILFFAAVSIVATKSIHAQSSERQNGPSLAETEHWIENTFNNDNVGYFQPSTPGNSLEESYSIVFEGCKLGLETSEVQRFASNKTPNEQQSSVIYYVDLKDIDPASIRVDGHINIIIRRAIVGFKTTNDDRKIAEYSFPNKIEELVRPSQFKKQSHYDPQMIFKTDHVEDGMVMAPDYAPRFIKAMRHATQLCGGKKSTF